VAPGFEHLRDVFEKADIGDGGASFAAYVGGRRIADLWAGNAKPGVAWSEDTVSTVMSTTKGMAALCAQLLWDRGELDVDAEVSRYWPQYAQAGKDGTLVRHILTHTSGMLCFTDPGELLDWSGSGWDDYDEIAKRIAQSPPLWRPGTRIGYHGISYGWLLQELVRRITGDTLGTFFAREIAEPLGVDIHIGTPAHVQERMADIITTGPKPRGFTKIVDDAIQKTNRDPQTALAQASLAMHGSAFGKQEFLNLATTRSAEIPAANGTANARGIARVYAMLAGGGELDGTRIVSPESIELFRSKAASGPTQVWPTYGPLRFIRPPKLRYALGYEGEFGEVRRGREFGPSPSAFGHRGAGGQIGFADPQGGVAVSFTRSHYTNGTAATALIDALYEGLDRS
jgi:CubicO group peptidase (beta-lactamase class C family)